MTPISSSPESAPEMHHATVGWVILAMAGVSFAVSAFLGATVGWSVGFLTGVDAAAIGIVEVIVGVCMVRAGANRTTEPTACEPTA
jgi:hypothetical protein